MIPAGTTYLVMGLLDRKSLAWAIGNAIQRAGGTVIYTVQSETLRKRYLDPEGTEGLTLRYCDATDEEQVRAVFRDLPPLAGVVHSIAYANPKTCLGEEFHTEAVQDILKSYHASAVSLATVTRHAVAALPQGGSVVALSFDTRHAYALYNWMGVHKAALEALVRALARRHGRDGVRVNAVSAGPLDTSAAARIPGFDRLLEQWRNASPLPWDPVADKAAVADAVVFLLGPGSRKITGQVLTVDGGASIVGGALQDQERAP